MHVFPTIYKFSLLMGLVISTIFAGCTTSGGGTTDNPVTPVITSIDWQPVLQQFFTDNSNLSVEEQKLITDAITGFVQVVGGDYNPATIQQLIQDGITWYLSTHTQSSTGVTKSTTKLYAIKAKVRKTMPLKL